MYYLHIENTSTVPIPCNLQGEKVEQRGVKIGPRGRGGGGGGGRCEVSTCLNASRVNGKHHCLARRFLEQLKFLQCVDGKFFCTGSSC